MDITKPVRPRKRRKGNPGQTVGIPVYSVISCNIDYRLSCAAPSCAAPPSGLRRQLPRRFRNLAERGDEELRVAQVHSTPGLVRQGAVRSLV
jgi:hypothetical protein